MKPFFASIAVVFIAAGQLGAADVLNKEPSFEGAPQASGLPEGWQRSDSEPAGGYKFRITDEGHSGEKALLIEGAGKYCVVSAEMMPVDRALQYHARGFVRIEGDEKAAADVKFHYFGAGGEYLGQSRVGFVNPRTKGWQLVTVTDELDLWPAAKFIGVAVALAGDGRASFDDIEVTAEKRTAAPLNLVANGNMEDVAADRPAGWFVASSEGNKVTVNTDRTEKRGGKQSLHITADGEWASAASPWIPIDRSKTYSLTGWAKVKRGAAFIIWAYFADGKYLGATDSEPIEAGDWQSRTVQAVPGDFPEATHLAAVASAPGDTEAWFDDFAATAAAK